MLRWDQVRRLIVQHAAPAVKPLGFGAPGRTMRRYRQDFVDVIDFRCSKWNDRAVVAFGCDLRQFPKFDVPNPKPWECTFGFQPLDAWPERLLEFQGSVETQIESLRAFTPLFAAEVQRWFGLLPSLQVVREAVDHNTFPGPNCIGSFKIPSPAYHEAVRKLEAALAAK
ncbi:MAG: DUF4304 domain-containing protein [Bacillota bacterium]